jgi:hypothetical protein
MFLFFVVHSRCVGLGEVDVSQLKSIKFHCPGTCFNPKYNKKIQSQSTSGEVNGQPNINNRAPVDCSEEDEVKEQEVKKKWSQEHEHEKENEEPDEDEEEEEEEVEQEEEEDGNSCITDFSVDDSAALDPGNADFYLDQMEEMDSQQASILLEQEKEKEKEKHKNCEPKGESSSTSHFATCGLNQNSIDKSDSEWSENDESEDDDSDYDEESDPPTDADAEWEDYISTINSNKHIRTSNSSSSSSANNKLLKLNNGCRSQLVETISSTSKDINMVQHCMSGIKCEADHQNSFYNTTPLHSSIVENFILNRCLIQSDHSVSASVLYDHFMNFEEKKKKSQIGSKSFFRAMGIYFCKSKTNGTIMYRGVTTN